MFADDGVCAKCGYTSHVRGLRRVCAPSNANVEMNTSAAVGIPTLADLEELSRNASDPVGFENFAPIGVEPPSHGPGTELSKLLKRFGIEPTPTCACRAKAAKMDAWGPDECSKPERIEEVVGVMREEAKARGLPFIDAAGRMLVRRAIHNARKQQHASTG